MRPQDLLDRLAAGYEYDPMHGSLCNERDQLKAENAKLREYVTKLETANLDVTARLTDYIGQYDPTDAFVVEVKAQNTKLRGDVERMFNANVKKNGEITRLLDENDKLRELVRDMWFWHYEGHIDNESQENQMKHIDGVLDRMRGLGIEVDE